jgi:hypothetical protein
MVIKPLKWKTEQQDGFIYKDNEPIWQATYLHRCKLRPFGSYYITTYSYKDDINVAQYFGSDHNDYKYFSCDTVEEAKEKCWEHWQKILKPYLGA